MKKTYTLTIKANECVLSCSDGRTETYATDSKVDGRIVKALMACKLAGHDVRVRYA